MCLRLGILFFLLHLLHIAQAQKDSILLSPVVIFGLPEEKYLVGSRLERLDSVLGDIYNSNHLGEVLAFQFPVYFRNYGNGMISGISMRGTSPQHTAVLWNGININSFSLGQSDFSILPTVAFDEVKVHTGGGSARFGSGAIGGAVLLSSGSSEKSILSARQEVGSFGRYSASVKTSFNKDSFTFSSSLYHLQSKNNFIIHKTRERQKNAEFQQQGFVQSIRYSPSPTQELQLDYWVHIADREIQPSTGNQTAHDQQQDRNHRVSISYKQNNRFGLMRIGGGVVNDKIVFNESAGDIFRWIGFVNHQFSFPSQWNIQTTIDWNHIIGKIKEYGKRPQEDRIDLGFSIQKTFERAALSATLRQPLVTNMKPPLLPYLGVEVFILERPNHELKLSASASKNFRAPTLNDRYWPIVGSKDLLPEKSYAAESGVSWKYSALKVGASVFYQWVDQWILWSPDSTNTYRPGNIKKVNARGSEASIELQWKNELFSQGIRGSYQFTKSTTEEAAPTEAAGIGKQLIYTPLHTAAFSIVSRFKSWHCNVFVQYSGQRFTEASNSPIYSLDPYLLTDISFGKTFDKNRHVFSAQFLVKNIFNIEYEQYSARAMPGRNVALNVSYQLKQKPN